MKGKGIRIGSVYKVGNFTYTLKDIGTEHVWLMGMKGKLRPMLRMEFEMNKIYITRLNTLKNILFRLNLLKIKGQWK